jgi:membrane protein
MSNRVSEAVPARLQRAGTQTAVVVRAVVREIRTEKLTFMAGSIAFHAFLSLLPTLLLVLYLLSEFGSAALADRVLGLLVAVLTPQGLSDENSVALLDLAHGAAQNASVSFVGGAVLLWGALRIFRGLDTAFSDIYESEAHNPFHDQVRDGIVVLFGVGLAVAVVAFADAVIPFDAAGPLAGPIRLLGTVVGISLAFFPLYYVFPDEDVTVREVLPGTVFAAVGWMALARLFELYVSASSTADSFGLVGSVIVLLTWLYFSGLVVLVGAAINAVLAGRSEDVANIAWGAVEDASENDADFVASLSELEAVLDGNTSQPVTIRVGDTEVTLPPAASAHVSVTTVDRPGLLGGNRETAEVRLEWDSRED